MSAVVGAYALALVLIPEKLGAAGAPGFAPQQPGGFVPGTANYGQQPAQPNYGQQPPAAPNYGQQQGQPQGGFPPVPPQGAPGQQYPGQQPPPGLRPAAAALTSSPRGGSDRIGRALFAHSDAGSSDEMNYIENGVNVRSAVVDAYTQVPLGRVKDSGRRGAPGGER